MNWSVEDALDAQYDAYLASLEASEEPPIEPGDEDWPDWLSDEPIYDE